MFCRIGFERLRIHLFIQSAPLLFCRIGYERLRIRLFIQPAPPTFCRFQTLFGIPTNLDYVTNILPVICKGGVPVNPFSDLWRTMLYPIDDIYIFNSPVPSIGPPMSILRSPMPDTCSSIPSVCFFPVSILYVPYLTSILQSPTYDLNILIQNLRSESSHEYISLI